MNSKGEDPKPDVAAIEHPGAASQGPRVQPGRSKTKAIDLNHASIGIKNEIWEHEDERLKPGSSGGSASGAGPNKPKGPSNSS